VNLFLIQDLALKSFDSFRSSQLFKKYSNWNIYLRPLKNSIGEIPEEKLSLIIHDEIHA